MTENFAKSTKRKLEFDVIKGLGIFFVVVGHVVQRCDVEYDRNVVFKFIYSFHMPLLMFASGMVLALKIQVLDLKWIGRKAERLVLPFFIWMFIEYYSSNLSFTGLNYRNYDVPLHIFILDTFLHPGGVWFLWALFLNYCLFFVASNCLNRSGSIWRWILVVIAVFPLSAIHIAGLSYVGRFYIYLIVGYLVVQRGLVVKWLQMDIKFIVLMVFSLVIFAFSFTHWPFVDGWPLLVKSPLLKEMWIANRVNMISIKTLVAFVGLFSICSLGLLISKIKPISVVLSKIGVYSIEIYVCHRLFLNTGFGYGWLKLLSTIVLSFVLAYYFQAILQGSRVLNWLLFGNKRKYL